MSADSKRATSSTTAVAVLLVLGGRYLYQRSPKQRERRQIKSLVIACDRDQDLAERPIFAEMERQEGLSFAEAARRARNRLGRDMRLNPHEAINRWGVG